MAFLIPARVGRLYFAAAVLALGAMTGHAKEVSALDLKAVFLLRFGNFTEWPEPSLSSPGEPFVIGILGADPFGQRLDQAVQGEMIGERPITIRRFQHANEVRECSILFISASEAAQQSAILATLDGLPILTVSDIEGFAQAGGMVHFFMHQNRVRLRVNLDAVRRAGLTISSKLLRAVEIVKESGLSQ
jgi:hypothetical protein